MCRRATAAAVALALPLLACGQAPQPVATVEVVPTEISLPYPGYSSLRLEWGPIAALGEVEGQPLVFVHLLDQAGSVVRTFDHPLPFAWRTGEKQSYEIPLYQSALAPPLDRGEYRLSLGLYDRSGRRWALDVSGEEVAESEYAAARVRVDDGADGVPMFYFSPSWLPLEAGTDVQILGRRWLTDAGALRVAEVPGEGSIWLTFRIPPPEEGLEELSLAEGETEPSVRIAGSCSDEEKTVSGFGSHQVRIPLTAGADGELAEECEIVVEPNYYLVEVKTLARRSLALEILSWARR